MDSIINPGTDIIFTSGDNGEYIYKGSYRFARAMTVNSLNSLAQFVNNDPRTTMSLEEVLVLLGDIIPVATLELNISDTGDIRIRE